MNRRVLVHSLAVAPVALGIPSVQAQPAPVTLRLLASPVDDVMPVLHAQRAGLFRQAGLNVVLDHGTSGGAVAAAVAGGAVEVGKVNIVAVITAHARNVPMTIVAPAAIYDPKTPDAVLVTRKDSPIVSARDLIGKTVGAPSLAEIGGMAVQAWLDANGADWHRVGFIEVGGYAALLAALEAGRVQAISLVKPYISEAVDSGKVKVLGLSYSAIANRFLESVWVADSGYVERNKPAVAAFQRVLAQSSAYTNAHQSETVDLLASWASLDPQLAAHMPRMVTGTSLDPRDIQPVIEVAAKYGLIPKSFDAREMIASVR
jgi:NitT/TauT family transport system substrate-binding protein